MCESNAYIIKEGKEELLAKDISYLSTEKNKVVLISIEGKRYELDNTVIDYIDFLKHKIVLKPITI